MKTPRSSTRRAVEDLRPLGQVTARTCTRSRSTSADFGAQADELPGALPDLRDRPRSYRDLPLRDERGRPAATATSARRAARPHARPRTSRRTTPTSSAPRSRSRRRSAARSTIASRSTRCSASRTAARAVDAAREAGRRGRVWDRAEAALAGRARQARGWRRGQRGRRRLLRAEDRLPPDATRIGRRWQLGTFQLDYQPAASGSSSNYIGADGHEHRPVMIHRAMLGSFERFIGILIEHYAGGFPLWLAPTQARGAADRRPPRRLRRAGRGRARGGRGARRGRRRAASPSGKKIAEAEGQKVPVMLVVGDREAGVGGPWPCAATARSTWARSRWPS